MRISCSLSVKKHLKVFILIIHLQEIHFLRNKTLFKTVLSLRRECHYLVFPLIHSCAYSCTWSLYSLSHHSDDLQRSYQPSGLLSHWVLGMRSSTVNLHPQGIATMPCHFPLLPNPTKQNVMPVYTFLWPPPLCTSALKFYP